MNYHPVCVQNLGFKTILESFFVPISMRHFIIFFILFMIEITYSKVSIIRTGPIIRTVWKILFNFHLYILYDTIVLFFYMKY